MKINHFFKRGVCYDDYGQPTKKLVRHGRAYLLPLVLLLSTQPILAFEMAVTENGNAHFSNTDIQNSITGRIVGTDGQPLAGVTVHISPANIKSSTDGNGRFTVNVNNLTSGSQLIVSGVGYIEQRINISSKRDFQITLVSEESSLEEVVVVGYGTQKKVNLTGSVDVVSGEALANRPATNISDLIKGTSPNMNINMGMRGGEPGAASSWNIRGVGSINGNSSPLILVDGVEMDINALDPESVESVSILKDASSSAVYGSRAPFGVVLITTKKGKKNEGVQVNYTDNFSFSKPIGLPSFIDSYTWATAYNQAAANAGQNPIYSDEQMQRIKGYLDGTFEYEYDPNNPIANVFHGRRNGNANYDWPHVLMGNNALSQKHNLSVTGGGDKTQYYLSGGYNDQQGAYAFGYDYMKRYNILSNLTTQVTDWFKINSSIKYAHTKTDFPLGETTVGREHTFREMLTFAPMMPYYNVNGTVQSPLVNLLERSGRDKNNRNDLVLNLGGEIEPIKGWKTSLNYNYNIKHGRFSQNPKPVMVELGNGTFGNIGKPSADITTGYSENVYKILNFVSSYETNIEDHYLKGMVGYEQEENLSNYLSATGAGLITEELPSLSTALGTISVYDQISDWATRGVFGRLNYNYKEKYLFEASARYNGSSKFPEHNRFGFFPSFSVGYNISKEDFFQPLSNHVNALKVRGSYGSLGNQNVANYLYLSSINVSPEVNWIINNARPQYATVPSLISNNITWETITTLNLGLDASFFKSRLGVTFDWYHRKTTDMLGPTETLPFVLGAITPLANNADLSTKGYELVLNWNDAINQDFSYDFKFVLGDSKSKILSYTNVNGLLDTWYAGKEYGEIWGLTTGGLIQTAGEQMADQSFYHRNWGPGDMKYVDINGDGKIDEGKRTLTDHGDLKIIGNSSARYNIGISAGFRFKALDFNMFWQGIGKRDFAPAQTTQLFWGTVAAWQNSGIYKDSPALDYWRPSDAAGDLGPNTNAYLPKPYFTVETEKNRQVQTGYLLNAAYLRLKNVQVGYTVPSSVAGKVFSKARVYFSGENLLTFTSLPKVFDPETTVASDPRNGGYTAVGTIYPLNRVISFGLNLTLK